MRMRSRVDLEFWRRFVRIWLLLAFGLMGCNAVWADDELPSPEDQQRLAEIDTLFAKIQQLMQQSRFQEAMPLSQRSLELARQVFGENHPDTADFYGIIGSLHQSLGDFKSARRNYEKSLAINQATLGDHPRTAISLGSLGTLLRLSGQPVAARVHLEKALAILSKTLGEEHRQTAIAHSNLGELLREIGDLDAALPHLEQSLKAARQLHGEEHPETATALSNLGLFYQSKGDHAAARRLIEEALAIRRRKFGDKHISTAGSHYNLGAVLKDAGDLRGARREFETSLEIHRAVFRADHPRIALVLSNLGITLTRLGEFAAARDCLDQSLAIYLKAFGNQHPETAAAHSNLGKMLLGIGEMADARSHLELAVAGNLSAYGEQHSFTALARNDLGLWMMQNGRLADALQEFERALAAYRARGSATPTMVATTVNNLAGVSYLAGDYSTSKKWYEAALKLRFAAGGENHPDTALAHNNLGTLLGHMGEQESAREHLDQALKIRRVILGESHPSTAVTLGNLARLSADLQDWDTAAAQTMEARRIVRRHVAKVLPSLPEREQLQFLLGKDVEAFHNSLSLGLQPRPQMAALSAEWLLNGKGVAHEATTQQALLERDLVHPELRESVQNLLDVRSRLAQLTLAAPKAGQAAKHRQEMEALAADETRLSSELARRTGRPDRGDPWVTLDAVRAALPESQVLIEVARFYVRDFGPNRIQLEPRPSGSGAADPLPDRRGSSRRERYVAWVIPPRQRGEVRLVDLGAAESIDQAVREARQAIESAPTKDGLLRQEGERAAEAQTRAALKQLAERIWSPIAPYLEKATTLVISPDSSLWLTPWCALPIANDQYLIERYSLKFVTSGRELVDSNNAAPPQRTAPAIFANPDFDLSPSEVTRLSHLSLGNNLTIRRSAGTVSSKLPQAAPLPGTAVEADIVTPNLKRLCSAEPRQQVGSFALEGTFKQLKSPRAIVAATHGFALPNPSRASSGSLLEIATAPITKDGLPFTNSLLRCGLLLTGCNPRNAGQPGESDDGVLTGMEIVGIDLRGTDLVVLSACETGLGDVQNSEGVSSVQRAFQLAGAETVMATLWQIPDQETARQMNDFFANLADGQPKSEALRNAQLKRIQSRRDRYGAAHPFFWAAFTMTGRE